MLKADTSSVNDALALGATRWIATVDQQDRTETSHAVLRVVETRGHPSPEVARERGVSVLFDGVLHNARELRATLDVAGSTSDPHLVLKAYHRWGVEFVGRLKGLFSVVVWDEREGTVLAGRDRLGVWPLYYALHRGQFVCSPCLATLASHVDAQVSRPMIVDYLCHRSLNKGETFFERVFPVDPAHVVHWRRGADVVSKTRYWEPRIPTPDRWVREDELEHFDELLEQAVARSMGHGRTGIFLSGGLDSVSVAAVATELARRSGAANPLALSIDFSDPECSEASVQRRVASELGVPQVMMPFAEAAGPEGLLWSAVETARTLPWPLLNPWLPAYDTLRKRGRDAGCAVVLTGGGGDEWLTVGPGYATDCLRNLAWSEFWTSVSATVRSYRLGTVAQLRYLLWTAGVRALLGSYGMTAAARIAPRGVRNRWRRNHDALVRTLDIPDAGLRKAVQVRTEEHVESRANRPVPRQPYGFYETNLREIIASPMNALELEEKFEAGRRSGVVEMQPYWDADVIDFLVRVPPSLLLRGGRSKALVRDAVARRFPRLGFERQKKISATRFFVSLVRSEGAAAWKRLQRGSTLVALGIVSRRAIDARVDRALDSEVPAITHQMWDLLVAEAWLRGQMASNGS